MGTGRRDGLECVIPALGDTDRYADLTGRFCSLFWSTVIAALAFVLERSLTPVAQRAGAVRIAFRLIRTDALFMHFLRIIYGFFMENGSPRS